MPSYFRIRLGSRASHTPTGLSEGFVGVDYLIREDLTGRLPDELREFNREFVPVCMEQNPRKTKIGAGLNMGTLWTVAKGIAVGDVVLCPDADGSVHAAEITSEYVYERDGVLPHRRIARWLDATIHKQDLSDELASAVFVHATVCSLDPHRDEIAAVLKDTRPASRTIGDDLVEDVAAFAMERHLEDFLVRNWASTELGTEFGLFTDDGTNTQGH